VAANYRAARRARSHKEFIAKLGVVEEESDESEFWLDLTSETNILSKEEVDPLLKEAGELTAIFTASNKTAKGNPNYRI
jgi:four helix bundle protein